MLTIEIRMIRATLLIPDNILYLHFTFSSLSTTNNIDKENGCEHISGL